MRKLRLLLRREASGDLALAEKASIIFLNNRPAGPDQPLKDGDTLALFPPVGGG